MLGKLSKGKGDGALQKAIESIVPRLQEHLENAVAELTPALIKDDDSYRQSVVSPALVVASGASGGVTSFIPGFKEKFGSAMMHLRDELLVCDDTSVALAENSRDRLPEVLTEGFKK